MTPNTPTPVASDRGWPDAVSEQGSASIAELLEIREKFRLSEVGNEELIKALLAERAQHTAALAAREEQEREACAAVLQGWIKDWKERTPKSVTAQQWAVGAMMDCIDAIRARGTTSALDRTEAGVRVPLWIVQKIADEIRFDRREGSRMRFGAGDDADTWEDYLEAPKDAVEALVALLPTPASAEPE